MPQPPWRSPLTHALEQNRSRPDARYLQLATLRRDGRPANRTLVFRGFRDQTDQLQFATDRRSAKVGQIAAQAVAEACWYFPQTQEQFRLAGELILIGPEAIAPDLRAARTRLWQTLSDATRLQFVWPPPGTPRAAGDRLSDAPPDPLQPLDCFGLLLLEPDQVEHLQLQGNPQNRWRYRRQADASWTWEAIYP